ncbi:olfactory receptor 4K17-like, partial [Pocillopora damicornis]|uniref:olfactory receptor 4K17-like n=1 Tax=Pocillopora damicornis TaxID=46731 RepID=UPI000F554714
HVKLLLFALFSVLYILTIVGNGFVIFLVCRKRQLRTETNTFIVSLAVADFALGVIAVPLRFLSVADFCVGMIAVPSRFLCDMVNKCITSKTAIFIGIYVRVFLVYASGSNLYSLALERYIAVAKPLKYLTFMTSRRVIQMVLTSWAIPFLLAVILLSMTLNSFHRLSAYFHLFFE